MGLNAWFFVPADSSFEVLLCVVHFPEDSNPSGRFAGDWIILYPHQFTLVLFALV